jgi:large subunit ribosomal protein L18
MATKKDLRRLRIKRNIRKKVSGTAERPRFSIFRSNTSINVQIIDDTKSLTLVSASSKEVGAVKSTNVEIAAKVGKLAAEKALAAGIKSVTFDRNGYLYHGKVKAVADAAREGGLNF